MYFVFTRTAEKYFVFVFKYICRVFCPSLSKWYHENAIYDRKECLCVLVLSVYMSTQRSNECVDTHEAEEVTILSRTAHQVTARTAILTLNILFTRGLQATAV